MRGVVVASAWQRTYAQRVRGAQRPCRRVSRGVVDQRGVSLAQASRAGRSMLTSQFPKTKVCIAQSRRARDKLDLLYQ